MHRRTNTEMAEWEARQLIVLHGQSASLVSATVPSFAYGSSQTPQLCRSAEVC